MVNNKKCYCLYLSILIFLVLCSCDSYNAIGIKNENYDSLAIGIGNIEDYDLYEENIEIYKLRDKKRNTITLKKGQRFILGFSINSIKKGEVPIDTCIAVWRNDTIKKIIGREKIFNELKESPNSERYYIVL